MRAFVIIPAYEPGERLVALAKDFFCAGMTVIVVDDGSSHDKKPYFDGASQYAEVIVHAQNRGKGAAIKTGYTRALELAPSRPDCVTAVVVDCDGQHLTSDAIRVAAEAEANPGSFVLGVRNVGREMPARSRFGNSVTRIVFKMLTGVYVSDTQTGLRACDLTLCRRLLEIDGDRYEYESNTLINLAKSGVKILEVPIETIYTDRKNSVSHFHAVSDSYRIYSQMIKAAGSPFIRFTGSSFLSFCFDYALFNLFLLFIGGFEWGEIIANVAARILSAGFNYMLNCKFVFGKHGSPKSVAEYVILATIILVLNSSLLVGYTELGLHPQIAKLCTEITLFILSFTVQRFVIFRKKKFNEQP